MLHAGDARRDAQEIEQHLALLATAQHGVVARRQLAAIGMGRGAIGWRLRAGRLLPLHTAVYAVGHRALRREAYWMAGVLACGGGALLSHRCAGAGLRLRAYGGTRIEISVPHAHASRRPGLVVHRRSNLEPCEVASCHGIPCTSVALTLLDLAAVLRPRDVERACDQAEVEGVFDLDAVLDVLRRRSGHRGAGVLRRVLGEHAIGTTLTVNDLEESFLALCGRAAVPRPLVNEPVVGRSGECYRGDFVWHRERLVVETDGGASHTTRSAFESDRRRDADLVAAGWRVVRFTWLQVTRDPAHVAAVLASLFRPPG